MRWVAGLVLLAAAGEAGLVCDQPVYDYGTISASDPVIHSFLLKNSGASAVKIIKVRKTCGCVIATASKKEVEPGGSAEIRVSVSLKGRSGKQSKAVYVHTDSKRTPFLRLEAKGMVRRDLTTHVPARAPVASRTPAPASRPVATPVKPSPQAVNKGLYTVPNVIRLPRNSGPEGVTVRIEVKPPATGGFRLKGVFPPADVSFAVERSKGECWIELGPIHDVQALKGSVLVVLTTSGSLRISCIIEE